MDSYTQAYLRGRRELAGGFGAWRDIVIAVLGAIIGWVAPVDMARTWAVVDAAVAAVVLYEAGAYVWRFVWAAPKQMYFDSLKAIARLEKERDGAKEVCDGLRVQLASRTERAGADEQRIQSLEAQVAGATRMAAERIGREDWQKLADHFANMPGFDVRGDWYKADSGEESWRIAGGWSDCRNYETLCRQAGTMLLKSPHVLEKLSGAVVSHTDPVWRWLEFLKEREGGLGDLGHGFQQYEDGQRKPFYFGKLADVKAKSARACRDCATLEI